MLGTERERLKELDKLYPDWQPHTLWTRFDVSAKRFENHEFLVCESCTLTYSQTREQIDIIAKGLLALGVKPGDHVAILLHNCPEFLFLTFALSKIGAIKIPLNTQISRKELSHVLCQSEAAFMVSEKILDDTLLEELPLLQKLVIIKKNQFYRSEKILYSQDFLRLAETVSDAGLDCIAVGCQNPAGISDIMFTSGSTSLPKGVMLTHDMLLRSAYGTCRCRRMEIGRRLFVPIPFFHLFAYVEGLLTMLLMGGAVIFSNQKFAPVHALELMRLKHANDIICVSIIMMDLLSQGNPKPEDFPDMHAAYWASTCPHWVWDQGRAAFGITDVTTGYGMTECCSTSTLLTPADPPDYVKHCNGQVKPGGAAGLPELDGKLLHLKICDLETGEELPAGEIGEILCSGVTVTPGYYKNPTANAAAFDENGWFRTGDMGSLDSHNYLTFHGRSNDMYKINGENVSPQFLDSVLGQCPLIKAVETVGVEHPKCGEVGVAFIDAQDDSDETKAEIRRYCRKNLASFQVPKYYFFSDSATWPRTGSGKLKKSVLRKLALRCIEQYGAEKYE